MQTSPGNRVSSVRAKNSSTEIAAFESFIIVVIFIAIAHCIHMHSCKNHNLQGGVSGGGGVVGYL